MSIILYPLRIIAFVLVIAISISLAEPEVPAGTQPLDEYLTAIDITELDSSFKFSNVHEE